MGIGMGKPWLAFENMKKYRFDTGLPYQPEGFTQDEGRTRNEEMSDGRVTILCEKRGNTDYLAQAVRAAVSPDQP